MTEQPSKESALKRAHARVREKMVSYIAGAFGLVAALAWNEAIKGLIDGLVPETGNSIMAKWMYAVIITLVVVVVLYVLEKTSKEE